MASTKNILVIRLKSIGDVVLTLPAVSVLRENFPAAKISFLTTRENAALLRGFRDVDETIALDRAILRSGKPWRAAGELFRLLRRLRAGKFSLAVDLQGNGESAWLTRFTGARQRWGVVHRPGRRWAYTQWIARQRAIHAAEMHLELLRHGGLKTGAAQNKFFLPADALGAAKTFFAANRLVPEKPALFVQPLTSSPGKNWPLENYLALARHWQARGWQIVFGGGPADSAALEPARAAGFAVAAGVPLLVTGGLMQLSALTVGGDTGALHLAVAQGKRVVMLMNNGRPGRPHPFRHSDWSLPPPENRKIATIKLDAVIAATEQALTEN
ncbi:MAG TPA: glycosyltransferase family 9 protein [Verrucomicrobiae bacterium]|jgi:ADP-heptose:LPS heptosyltransferase